ncbi:MAG: MTAP family purine nucleoside phosphorylase, partial [Candidatus Micrarchaeaceae archaeon]
HIIPPHMVPYKANIEALNILGVERIIGINAVGSLNPDFKPGDFAIFGQFINFTSGRDDTFFNGPNVVHISTAEPYCPELREIAVDAAKEAKIKMHSNSTVMVINGPRFSTKAESKMFSAYADLINMTHYPEIALAREKAMCYLGIGIVTDYDAGLAGREDIAPVTYEDVKSIFASSIEKLHLLIEKMLPSIGERKCNCKHALDNAKVSN